MNPVGLFATAGLNDVSDTADHASDGKSENDRSQDNEVTERIHQVAATVIIATAFSRSRKWKSVIDRGLVGHDPHFPGKVRNVGKRISPVWRLPSSRFSNDLLAGFFHVIEKVRTGLDCPV
jgi:hypothetical protein